MSEDNETRPLEVELLVPAHSRRLSVAGHHAWRESLSAQRDLDDIDRELDEMIEVDPGNFNPPSRRKDSELARMLELLDNLPTGKDSE